jgi:2-polyprenyl-3-methyl-5-hydroxy-6-metoxy-1,4-benzoquinol methylase
MHSADDAARRDQERDSLVERLAGANLGAMELASAYLGARLGLYEALATSDALTPADLAVRAGIHERYAREWLEQQAVAAIVTVDDPAEDPFARRYRLSPAHAEVLTDADSLSYFVPFLRGAVAMIQALPLVLGAFRTGGGVAFSDYGEEFCQAVATGNRPSFFTLLGRDWFPAIPDLHARLQADPPARVADVGCGQGFSSLGIARAYPKVTVDGLDLDERSIAAARANAEAAGLADRAHFHCRDAGDPALAGRYDLACAFECIHDMAQPVPALRAMRQLVGQTGTVLVVDERVAETFAAPGDELERLFYAISLLHCLPAGMSEQPSVGTGTVMRPATLRRYAQEAGFRDVEVLPIESDFWRFYRLVD